MFHSVLFIFFNQEDGDIPTMQLAWESLIMAHLVFSRFVLKLDQGYNYDEKIIFFLV